MELLKQYVRMNRLERTGEIQLSLEEDFNLPDTKPDVSSICLEKGEVFVEEIRPAADAVTVKGKLAFSVLYDTRENGGGLERTEGKIPFEEKINLEGLMATEEPFVTGTVDDLTVGMINSRKLSVQSVVTLRATVDVISEEELPVGVAESGELQGDAQVRQVPIDFTKACLCRKDVCRIKEELSLPSGYPNLGRILWKSVEPGEMNFRLGEEQLYVQGELRVFVLYEGEGEDQMPQIYETRVNVSSQMACSGCREGMALDVRYGIAGSELTPKPDLDGELRELGLEVTLALRICVYEEERLSVVKDVYGVRQEIREQERTANLRQLVRCVTGKTRVADHLAVPGGVKPLQLIRGEAELGPVHSQVRDGGISIQGSLGVKILYVTGEDDNPYGCLKAALPFEYSLEIPGMKKEDDPDQIQARVEQLSLAMPDGEEVDVKAVLSFSVSVFRDLSVEVVSALSQEPVGREKLSALPGMVAYVVKEGEDLWSIGKKYYVPVQSIMDVNDLSSGEVMPGQKLLIIKGE